MTMDRIKRIQAVVIFLFLLGLAPCAWAGPYADALGKCLVSTTTPAEKTTLVRWIFAMMALHPDVESSSAVTSEQRTALSKETAELFQRLLTKSCEKESREAITFEGLATLQSSFSLLGQVAARELFVNPKVAAGMAEFSRYVDPMKLKELAAPPQP